MILSFFLIFLLVDHIKSFMDQIGSYMDHIGSDMAHISVTKKADIK